MQRHADAAYEAADILAGRQQRIEDFPGGEGGDDPANADLPKVGIDADFDEDCATPHGAQRRLGLRR